jgi:hypothetical protein
MDNIITDKIREVAAKVDYGVKLTDGERTLIINLLRQRAQKFERVADERMSRPKIDSPDAEKHRVRMRNYQMKIRLKSLMGGVE